MRVHVLKAAIAAATVASAIVLGVEPAVAGGTRLAPVRDRYEAGEMATLVGYTGGPQLEAHREPGPYRAFLEDEGGFVRTEIGTLELTDRGRRGWESLRVAVRFLIPSNVAPGHYAVTYCTGGCERPAQLGDLIGGFLSIGVDPPFPVSREWPADEPEIANLANDAIVTGPGYQATADAVRAGVVPRSAAPAPPPVASVATTAPAPQAAPAAAPPPEPAPALAPTPAPDTPWTRLLWAGVALTTLAGVGLDARRRFAGRVRGTAALGQ